MGQQIVVGSRRKCSNVMFPWLIKANLNFILVLETFHAKTLCTARLAFTCGLQ